MYENRRYKIKMDINKKDLLNSEKVVPTINNYINQNIIKEIKETIDINFCIQQIRELDQFFLKCNYCNVSQQRKCIICENQYTERKKNNMKNQFEIPEIEVLLFKSEDAILTETTLKKLGRI